MVNKILVLGVIPARAGSKGVPGKNIKMLNDKPLIYYSIKEALKSKLITDLVVSTDSKKIQSISIKYGAECPFLRPDELSTDFALAVPTIQHSVKYMEEMKAKKYDYIVMLQPTSPLRRNTDIDSSIKKLIKSEADGIISVVDVNNYHPMKMKRFLGSDKTSGKMVDYEKPPVENCPRQKLPPVFIVNGAIYATKRDVFLEKNSFQGDNCIGYIMDENRSINIDTEIEFAIAEKLMKGL